MFSSTIQKVVDDQTHFNHHAYNSIARIALASEYKPGEKQHIPFITNTDIVRLILRKTFQYKCFEWTFSIIYSAQTRSEAEKKMKLGEDPKFEIEIEINTLDAYFKEHDNLYICRSIFLKIQDILQLIG